MRKSLVEMTVQQITGSSKLEEAVTLDELKKQDQDYVDQLLKELGTKKLTPSEWKAFFAKVMKELNTIKR